MSRRRGRQDRPDQRDSIDRANFRTSLFLVGHQPRRMIERSRRGSWAEGAPMTTMWGPGLWGVVPGCNIEDDDGTGRRRRHMQ